MAEKRVVYPLYLFDVQAYSKKFWSMVDQLITSMASYFDAGNTVPIIVGTDSVDVKHVVERVSHNYGYSVTVIHTSSSAVQECGGKYAASICGESGEGGRLNVVTSKIFAMLMLAPEYDRLMVDIDTLWFKPIPWERFENDEFVMFAPEQWKHPLSITIGQVMHLRGKAVSADTIGSFYSELCSLDPAYRALPLISTLPWPNSGVFYTTSACAAEKYLPELNNPVFNLLSVEDEGPLLGLLLKGGKYYTDIQMNVPVAFTDITMENDVLHPNGVVCAHFHRLPKPDGFDITYSGVIRHPNLHEPYNLSFFDNSMASGQYGSMSGILWCYVWRYYFSIACYQYRNGNDTPIYKPDFWKKVIQTYYENRQLWLDSKETEKMLTRMPK